MATARGRGLRPGGVVRALLRLALFVVMGFGVGLVFGVVMEEPELLAGYLRGDGTEIPVVADAPSDAPRPAVEDLAAGSESVARSVADDGSGVAPTQPAARPTSTPAERPADLPEVAARSEQTSASTPVAAAAAAPRSATPALRADPPWAIQVGAFSDARAARKLARSLRDRYPVAVLPAEVSGGRFRVRVQPIESESEARAMAKRLKQEDRLPTWVTRSEAGPSS